MLDLKEYDVTPDRGFLTPYDMGQVILPEAFHPIIDFAQKLPGYLPSGRVRFFVQGLPEIDMANLLPDLDDAQKRMLMVHYSFIVQAYVWGEKQPPEFLPRNLAVPYCALAKDLGQFPLLPYASYTLDNWALLDPAGDVTLENIRVLQNFLGGQDENWFIMIHIEIEAKAGAALAAIPELLLASAHENVSGVVTGLQTCLAAWEKINPIFDRMVERCDPYIYYNRVRPYIHGWKGNPALPQGLIYQGVAEFAGKPQAFCGQTGSQSSIVPVMDALLGIDHEQDPLRHFLDELHAYRPPRHRRFIEDVAQNSQLRGFVLKTQDAAMTLLYNQVVDHVQRFRTRHLEFAASYINKQSQSGEGNSTEVGTGGTPFMKYLKKHRDESRRHFIGDYAPTLCAPLTGDLGQ